MPFPRLRMFGASDSGRGERRRNRRAQGEDYVSPEPIGVVAAKRQQRLGIGLGAFLILVIAGVVAFGYYKELSLIHI